MTIILIDGMPRKILQTSKNDYSCNANCRGSEKFDYQMVFIIIFNVQFNDSYRFLTISL